MSVVTQTSALLVDAYREMNARRLFWVTLILSAVVIGVFAFVGITPEGLSVFGGQIPLSNPTFWYKATFSFVLVGVWAKWAALILALVSTAGIFPELISGGAVDLYLSKPIGRLRLFFTKFVGGLLFVALQTTIFAGGSFLVFGLRTGQWRPVLFLMVPLIVLLYSYLFCFCVLVGVLTRSTLPAILLTVVFWTVCFGIHLAEQYYFIERTVTTSEARGYEQEVRRIDRDLEELKSRPSALDAFGFRQSYLRRRRDDAQRTAQTLAARSKRATTIHRVFYGVATVLPKTGETVDLLDRQLFSETDVAGRDRDKAEDTSRTFGGGAAVDPEYDASQPLPPTTNPAEAAAREQARLVEANRAKEERRQIAEQSAEETSRAARSRSVPWIIGTSLGFEAVILAWAAWLFCRRDY